MFSFFKKKEEQKIYLCLKTSENIMPFSNKTITFKNCSPKLIEAAYLKGQQILIKKKSPNSKKYLYTVLGYINCFEPETKNSITLTINFNHRTSISKTKKEDKDEYCYLHDKEIPKLDKKEQNSLDNIKEGFLNLHTSDSRLQTGKRKSILKTKNSVDLIDKVFVYLDLKDSEVKKYCFLPNFEKRLNFVKKQIIKINELNKIKSKSLNKIEEDFSSQERKLIIKEEIRQLQSELGDLPEENVFINEVEQFLKTPDIKPELITKVKQELNHLKLMNNSDPEYTVVRNYLEWLIELPWVTSTNSDININHAKKILEKDHFGLKEVKSRILEYLAVNKLTNKLSPTILCLSGPPGVGKTSLGKSIARSMNRKFARMSLGGITDESEIRGHRRSYIGALPGQIIQTIKQAGVNNPVIILDEIDKIGKDVRGNPAAALLEALDPEQNSTFRDNYIEVTFDLSNVFFITTSNNNQAIPEALLDRMEIIKLPGYTEEEKLQIAKKHIIAKQVKKHGLKPSEITFKDDGIRKIINEYTFEAGVRELERQFIKILSKVAFNKLSTKQKSFTINKASIQKYLGTPKYISSEKATSNIGAATGLAWTEVGGVLMDIETKVMPGSNDLLLTGNLGEILQESAKLALSYIRSNHKTLKLKNDFFEEKDIHIHLPEGGTPKDGPSAGVTLLMALISLFTNKKMKPSIAMTGEITLNGDVLPIGGLKEKILAAKRHKIKTVLIPAKNAPELKDMESYIKKGMKIIPIKNVQEAMKVCF